MFTGYSLWDVSAFLNLIWIVVLVFEYRLLQCLGGNVGWIFAGGIVDMTYFVVLSSVFHPLLLVLFYTVGVSIFSWVLTLYATVFVHRVVTSVPWVTVTQAAGEQKKWYLLVCRSIVWPYN